MKWTLSAGVNDSIAITCQELSWVRLSLQTLKEKQLCESHWLRAVIQPYWVFEGDEVEEWILIVLLSTLFCFPQLLISAGSRAFAHLIIILWTSVLLSGLLWGWAQDSFLKSALGERQKQNVNLSDCTCAWVGTLILIFPASRTQQFTKMVCLSRG